MCACDQNFRNEVALTFRVGRDFEAAVGGNPEVLSGHYVLCVLVDDNEAEVALERLFR